MSECMEVQDVSRREISSLLELGDVGLKGGWGFLTNGGMSMERVLRLRVVCWAGVGFFTLSGALAFGRGFRTGYTSRSTMLLLPGFST